MSRQKLDELDVKLLSVKTYGRSHLACLKCRSQKIKCSGTIPTCHNCLLTNHECKYPKRDRKITLLESQLDKLNNKIKYLENRLAEYNDITNSTSSKQSDFLNQQDIHGNTIISDIPNGMNSPNIEFLNTENGNNENNTSNKNLIKTNMDETIISLNPTLNITTDSKYFGTSSAQVFDSALKLHLCQIGSSLDTSLKPRHFFKDPNLSVGFSGAVLLPDKSYAVSLVEKVISFIGHEYYLFDTVKFFEDIDKVYSNPSKKNSLWICYFLITLAVGEQYLNYSTNNEIPGIRFYNSAMNLYKPSYEEPTLEFVQMLLLIAFYLQGLNSANSAFTFYGLASRAALIQGLHRKMDSCNPIEREKRKRVWWSVFVMENIWCANLGHPIHVQVSDIDIELPCENFFDLKDNFNCSVLEHNVKLAMIMGSVMKHVYIPSKGAISIKFTKMLNCLQELEQFQKDLPEIIKTGLLLSDNRSSANLYLRLNHDIMVTTRPLLLTLFKGHIEPSDVAKRVTLRCLNAAILNIDILEHLKLTNWLSTFGFWDAQFCFTSLMILIICSWSGNVYPQTEIAKSLHIYMRDAGNFTAADNDNRLSDLNQLLSKIPKYTKMFGSSIIQPKTPNKNENPDNLNIQNNTIKEFNKEINKKADLKTGDFIDPENTIKKRRENEDFKLSENFEEQKKQLFLESDANLELTLDHKINKNNCDNGNDNYQINKESISDFNQNIKLSDIVLKSPNFDFEQIGDFSIFRNNFSPDSWNELTCNEFLWDPLSNSEK